MNLQHIRMLIGEGETANAVKALLSLLQEGAGKNKRLRDDLLIISNQLQELKRKDTMGVLDNDEVRHQYAQLNSALLTLIEEMEVANPDSPNITQRQGATSHEPTSSSNKQRQWWWLLLPILVAGGVLGVFRKQIFYSEDNKEESALAPAPEVATELPSPLARFNFDNGMCQAPCEVRFNNESRYAERYQWNFGDGAQSTDEQPKHTYQSAGSYTVVLVAIKDLKRDSSFQKLQIGAAGKSASAPVQTPKAGFKFASTSFKAPCSILFTNTSTHASRYQWSVNGVSSGTNSNLNYQFEQAGQYEIRLVAISANGRDSYSTTVQINPTEETLLVGFAVDKKECEAPPCRIQFINRSAYADRYEWRINGQIRSTDKDFVQTFSAAGTYVIQLTGYRKNESKHAERSIQVMTPPPQRELNVVFNPDKIECEAPCQIQFINRSVNADRYEWRVNGQIRSNNKDFTSSFSSAGNYVIQLTGYQGTVSKNAERTIRIVTPPKQSNAPILLSPAPGAVFDHFPRATTLRWRPVSQALSYSVELDCMGCCASGKWCNDVGKKYQVKEGLSVTSYNFNWVGAQKGRWRVWAKLKDGSVTDKSEWREFDYRR